MPMYVPYVCGFCCTCVHLVERCIPLHHTCLFYTAQCAGKKASLFMHTCTQVLHEQNWWDKVMCMGSSKGWHVHCCSWFGCRNALVAKGWANSHLGCMNWCYSHLVGASFLTRWAAWVQIGCLLGENADYCKFVNMWVWLGPWICPLWLQMHLVQLWNQTSDRNWKMVCWCMY